MMTSTIATLESAPAQAYSWLKEIEETLGIEDRRYSMQALRGVLHALRDRLTTEQNAHLAAQLPLIIRGIYFEGWRPAAVPNRDKTVDDFIEHVRPAVLGDDWDVDLEEVVGAVFNVLQNHLSPGEAEKIGRGLPRNLAALWNQSAP